MRFVYKPEGAEPKSWEFAPGKLMNVEAETIEKHTGMTFGEWGQKVGGGSILAIHGLLYVLLKRTTPTLRWDDVQFCLDDVDFEVDDADGEEIIRNLEQKADLDDEELELLASLRSQRPAPAAEEEGDPKALTSAAPISV